MLLYMKNTSRRKKSNLRKRSVKKSIQKKKKSKKSKTSKRLQKGGDDQDDFINAVISGNIIEVKKLLNNDQIDPSSMNNNALYWASTMGHLDIVNLLLADERVKPYEAIRIASANGHNAVAERLLREAIQIAYENKRN